MVKGQIMDWFGNWWEVGCRLKECLVFKMKQAKISQPRFVKVVLNLGNFVNSVYLKGFIFS